MSGHLGEKRASERARESELPEALAWPPPAPFVDHAHVSSSHATLLHADCAAMRIRCDVEGGGSGDGGGADDYRANEIRMKRQTPASIGSYGEGDRERERERCPDNCKYFQDMLSRWIFPNYS